MERTHFVHIRTSYTPCATSDSVYADTLDDEPFVYEIENTPNPFDADDPEVAYHEYLARRFSER